MAGLNVGLIGLVTCALGGAAAGDTYAEVVKLAEKGIPFALERPVEPDTKVYWIPHSSIRYTEIIAAGSPSEKLDNEVHRRKMFTPQELHRLTES